MDRFQLITSRELAALFLFLAGLGMGLAGALLYELQPSASLVGKVTRLWQVTLGRLPTYYVEIEVEGKRAVYTCSAREQMKLRPGQVVRLHLKGTYARGFQPLDGDA